MIIENFCTKVLNKISDQNEEIIQFLSNLKQIILKYDIHTLNLHVVDYYCYLYCKDNNKEKKIISDLQLNQKSDVFNPNPLLKVILDDGQVLPNPPDDEPISQKKIKKTYYKMAGSGLYQETNYLSKDSIESNDPNLNNLKEKVIINLKNYYYKARYTQQISELDEEIIFDIDHFYEKLNKYFSNYNYKESFLYELDQDLEKIKLKINQQHELIKQRAKLFLPSIDQQFKVACNLIKINNDFKDLIENSFKKITFILNNTHIVSCHVTKIPEMCCAIIWKGCKNNFFNESLANLLLSIPCQSLPDHYKCLTDKNGVIKKASLLESAERVYKELSSSKITALQNQLDEIYRKFERFIYFNNNDEDVVFIENRLRYLQSISLLSEISNENFQNLDPKIIKKNFSYNQGKFLKLNDIEINLLNDLLIECKNNWQIKLSDLMKIYLSEYKIDSNDDLENKIYAKISYKIIRAKEYLDYKSRGQSIPFTDPINYSDPNSIYRGLKEIFYEEKISFSQQVKKCNLSDPELIESFQLSVLEKMEFDFNQKKNKTKEDYNDQKFQYPIFSPMRIKLKNKYKKEVKCLEEKMQNKKDFFINLIKKFKESSSDHVTLYITDSIPKEERGYFIKSVEPNYPQVINFKGDEPAKFKTDDIVFTKDKRTTVESLFFNRSVFLSENTESSMKKRFSL